MISCGVSKYLLTSWSLPRDLIFFPGYIDLQSEGEKKKSTDEITLELQLTSQLRILRCVCKFGQVVLY